MGETHEESDGTEVLVVCTGNAARSVMAGYMLEWLSAARTGRACAVTTAGTLAVSGQPMSRRTKAAILSIPELAEAPVGAHRSRQLGIYDVGRADVVIAMEADHVRYVRKYHPDASDRTATIRRLVRDLPTGSDPLGERLATLRLDEVELEDDEDVTDPAGGEDDVYVACAAELWQLCNELVDRL